MMLVVNVQVVVLYLLVDVNMAVFFANQQVNTGNHRYHSEPFPSCRRHAKNRDRQCRANKGRGRKPRRFPGRSEMSQRQHHTDQAGAAKAPQPERSHQQGERGNCMSRCQRQH